MKFKIMDEYCSVKDLPAVRSTAMSAAISSNDAIDSLADGAIQGNLEF